MPYYTLVEIETGSRWADVAAGDAAEAVARFSERVGKPLSLDGQRDSEYLMAEHEEPSPPFVYPSIAVFEAIDG